MPRQAGRWEGEATAEVGGGEGGRPCRCEERLAESARAVYCTLGVAPRAAIFVCVYVGVSAVPFEQLFSPAVFTRPRLYLSRPDGSLLIGLRFVETSSKAARSQTCASLVCVLSSNTEP